ncbi:MAG: hypothetical protein MAG795_00268 [Candidatus Woesearchaeota archaeon]|nr:hypothetical protein [Candidatus Woesearchaeota archaeon]
MRYMKKISLLICLLFIRIVVGCSKNNPTQNVVAELPSDLSEHNSADDCWVIKGYYIDERNFILRG